MRIAFFGAGAFGAPALDAICRAGHEVRRVISQPDRPAGRGRRVQPTPIRVLAQRLDLRHAQVEDVNATDAADLIDGAELAVVVAFGQKLGPALLDTAPAGFINLHASLLPKYRGAAPIQRAILEGESVTGVTIFQLDERWDAGAVWARRETPIEESETAADLHDRLAELGAELMVETLSVIASGTGRAQRQDAALATRAPKLSKAEGWVDFTQPAFPVARRINGLWSWPAAACRFEAGGRGTRVLLARAKPAGDDAPSSQNPPGALSPDGLIQTGAGRVRLLEIKPSGGKRMPFDAFARGQRLTEAARLVSPAPP